MKVLFPKPGGMPTIPMYGRLMNISTPWYTPYNKHKHNCIGFSSRRKTLVIHNNTMQCNGEVQWTRNKSVTIIIIAIQHQHNRLAYLPVADTRAMNSTL